MSIHPDLPAELKEFQVSLLLEYSLNERTGKPDKPQEVGYRARTRDSEDPLEEWWKVKPQTEAAALALIDSDVLPRIRENLGLLVKVAPKEKTPATVD